MSKKVIEQIKVVKYFGKGEKEPTVIDNPSAIELTTVAKAICPEYQKVIDQNAKLVEALRGTKKDMEWMWENLSKPHTSDHFNIPANAINSIEEILNTKQC